MMCQSGPIDSGRRDYLECYGANKSKDENAILQARLARLLLLHV